MPQMIPERSLIERQLPIEDLYELAIREGNSKKPVYQMHKWWARRLGTIFRFLLIGASLPSRSRISTLWKRFYSENDFKGLSVLDPFMGGGTSIVEATKCNARTIGVDIDPVASFVTRMEIQDINPLDIEEAFEQIDLRLGDYIRGFYKTEDADGSMRDVIYAFWVRVLDCETCGNEIKAHPNLVLGIDTIEKKKTVFCKQCHRFHELELDAESFRCVSCGSQNDLKSRLIVKGRVLCHHCGERSWIRNAVNGSEPISELFAIEYQLSHSTGRMYKPATTYDVQVFENAENELRKRWNTLNFPKTLIPHEGRSDLRPINYGYKYYWQLFNSRQLLCLSLIYEDILKIEENSVRDALLLAFSDTLANNNVMCLYEAGRRKLTPLFSLHAYNFVSRPIENNVWGTNYGRGSFEKCVRKVIKGKKYCDISYEYHYKDGKPKQIVTGEQIKARVGSSYSSWENDEIDSLLLTQSTENLSNVSSNSIELILTDPPYFDNLSYSELSDFYYAWLRYAFKKDDGWQGETTPYRDALFATPNSIDSAIQFTNGLTNSIKECQRVLKPEGLMVFTFHHRKIAAWASLLRAIKESGLVVTNTFPVRSEGKSGFHSTNGSIKWDAVLTCRLGQKEDFSIHLGHLCRHIFNEIHKWEEVSTSKKLSLGWADKLSFGYAVATKRLSNIRMNSEETLAILEGVQGRLLNLVPSQYKHLLSRDIQPQLLRKIVFSGTTSKKDLISEEN